MQISDLENQEKETLCKVTIQKFIVLFTMPPHTNLKNLQAKLGDMNNMLKQ